MVILEIKAFIVFHSFEQAFRLAYVEFGYLNGHNTE